MSVGVWRTEPNCHTFQYFFNCSGNKEHFCQQEFWSLTVCYKSFSTPISLSMITEYDCNPPLSSEQSRQCWPWAWWNHCLCISSPSVFSARPHTGAAAVLAWLKLHWQHCCPGLVSTNRHSPLRHDCFRFRFRDSRGHGQVVFTRNLLILNHVLDTWPSLWLTQNIFDCLIKYFTQIYFTD